MIKYYKQIYTLGNIARQTILSMTVTTVNMHSFNTGVSRTQAPLETPRSPQRSLTNCFINCDQHESRFKDWCFLNTDKCGEDLEGGGPGCESAFPVCLKGAGVGAS